MSSTDTFIYASLGGVLPALLWLAFWLREDRKRPEPTGRIAEAFFCGCLAVILVLPFQKWVAVYYPVLGFMPFFLWAILEEFFKFAAAYFSALRTRDDDEPLDPLVYMITAALGFVALENTLFIWNPLLESDLAAALSTGGMRFIGASLLHVLASSAMGLALALSFYKPLGTRILYGFIGLIFAIAIHTSFNVLILKQSGMGNLGVFAAVWVGLAALLLMFEKVKTIAPRKSQDII